MIDNAFRRNLPSYVGPLLGLYRRLGMTPNQVTYLGWVLALVAGGAVAIGYPIWALALWWLSRLADGTDGIFARATDQETEFGGYLDIVLDMAAYGVMVIGFAIAHPQLAAQWMAMLFLYILCITSALALGMQEARLELPPRDDRGLRLGAGLAEGGETGIAYSIFLLWPGMLPITTSIWVVLLLTTVVARTLLARRTLRAKTELPQNGPQSGSSSTRSDAAPPRM